MIYIYWYIFVSYCNILSKKEKKENFLRIIRMLLMKWIENLKGIKDFSDGVML